MLTENFSRRTFLKGSAALSTLLGLGAIGSKAAKGLVPTASAQSNSQKQQFYNACPRNCYDTCSIVTTVEYIYERPPMCKREYLSASRVFSGPN